MAAQIIYPTTVYVTGFPADASRRTLIGLFGGRKGYISNMEFINLPGEPKSAFITYRDEFSVPHALKMDGKRVKNHLETLQVRQVDEAVLHQHVPGQEHTSTGALQNMQTVLGLVLGKDIQEQTCSPGSSQRGEELLDEIEEMQRELDDIKAANEEQKRNELTSQLQDVRAQLEASRGRLSNAQAEYATMRSAFTETVARLKDAEELTRSQESTMKDILGQLAETGHQKESAIERLEIANNKATKLEEDHKALKYEYYETRAALRHAQVSLGEADVRLREEEILAKTADGKRARTEEWLADERQAKHRLISDMQELEARHKGMTQEIEGGYVEKLDALRARLETETLRRQQAEEQLAQANSKLDKGIVTDALMTAFIKLEDWGVRILGDEGFSVPSSSVT